MSTANVFAAGVKPLVIDLDMQPGDTKNFDLKFMPSGQEEQVKLSLYQPVQLLNGGLTYQKANPESFSVSNWVDLESNEVMVYPGQQNTVSGTVNVPFSAGGSHTVVIMVEPQSPAQKKGGINFMVRYAVRLNIRVDRPGLRPEAELVKFNLDSGEENEPIVKARLSNPSAWDYLVSGEVTIRDAERRLVERIPLRSPSGAKNNKDITRMYPGSEVKYLAEVTKRLTPETYTLRTFIRYGDHGQIIKTKEINIKEGDFNFPTADEIGAFSVEPKQIDLELKSGQRKSEVLSLNSEIADTAQIVVSGSEIEENYEYSLLEWLKLRGKNQFKLRGRSRGKAILTMVVPRDIKSGSYHGNVTLQAYNPETEKLLTKKQVPVSILVGNEQDYQLEVKSLHAKAVKEGQLLSLDLLNSGNAFINPTIDCIISDQDGKFVERLSFNLPKGVERILPLKRQRLMTTAKNLESGKYKAKIEIKYQGEDLTSVEKEFEVLE
jgi:hypothetical protein